MKNRYLFITFCLLLSGIFCSHLSYGYSQYIKLSATISDDFGPLEGYKRVIIDLYSDQTKTNWSETHDNVLFENGNTSLIMGTSSPFLESTGSQVNFLNIASPNLRLTIDGIESIITFNLHAVPYALDIPTLWTGSLLGRAKTNSESAIIHSSWIKDLNTSGPGGGSGGTTTLDENKVRDIVAVMVENNTELGLSATSSLGSDSLKKLDFNVNDPTITLSGDIIGSNTMTNLGNVSIATTLQTVPLSKGGTGAITATDARTNLELGNINPFSQNSITGLKITSPTWFTQTVYFTGGTSAFQPSDRNLKTNIHTIPNSIKKLKQINGVYYHWKKEDPNQAHFPNTKQVGVISQEIESVIPELVATGPDGYKYVNYMPLVALLIEAIKEQQQQIDTLTTQIKALTND